ncbi:MAG: NUDIX domain-containing protein [Candidatus Paceibacterota bacterium]
METKILIIAVIRKGNKVLFRKKPEGSLPYNETWYLFGEELVGDSKPEEIIKNKVKKQTGIDIKLIDRLGWDTEIKTDHDGKEKLFIYLDALCDYVSGKLELSEGIEKLEWIHINDLDDYDLVPPSRELFSKSDYIEKIKAKC